MTKLVWISDCHLSGRGDELSGQNTDDVFTKHLSSLQQACADAELFVCSGDVAHQGCETGYAFFKDAVVTRMGQGAHMPEVVCIPGNHDRRPEMADILGLDVVPGTDFIQFARRVGDTLVLGLDTLRLDAPAGEVCDTRLAWLQEQLQAHPVKRALVFTHHPLMPVGNPKYDEVGLIEGRDALFDLLRSHDVTADFCSGHFHFDWRADPAEDGWRYFLCAPFGAPHAVDPFDGNQPSFGPAPPSFYTLTLNDGPVQVARTSLG